MEVYPELIVMLTENDRTIKNAYEIFEKCKDSKAEGAFCLYEKPWQNNCP